MLDEGRLSLLGYQRVVYNANWKTYFDNDFYHAPLLHTGFRLLMRRLLIVFLSIMGVLVLALLTGVGSALSAYGYYAQQDKVHIHDLHATILALLGMNHEKLTYKYAGRDFRLTDVEGRVVKEVIA